MSNLKWAKPILDREQSKPMKQKKYVYFVSYSHTAGHGNINVTTHEPITKIQHIRDIEGVVEDDKSVNVIILNFILLREEDA